MQALKFSTANVGTLMGRGTEVVDMLSRRKLGTAGLQEVRYKNAAYTNCMVCKHKLP